MTTWRHGIFTVATCLLLSLAGTAQEPRTAAPNPFEVNPRIGPTDLGLQDRALIGAIDIHAHVEPDVPWRAGLRRAIDWLELAKLSEARGMRGFVHKVHGDSSGAGTAYMVRRHVAPHLEVFGRMGLNLATGGINVATIEHFAQIRGGWGRIVDMPTIDAESRTRAERPDQTAGDRPWRLLMRPEAPTAVTISKNGELLAEVKHLIAAMARIRTIDSQGRLVLSTGHSSGQEHVLLAREARKVGLQVVSPHGSIDLVTARGTTAVPGFAPSVAALQEFAKLGAYVELRQDGAFGSAAGFKAAAEMIRSVGAASIIVSTDCGYMNTPLPPDCLALTARGLRREGISEREIDLMFKENPARLLDLPVQTSTAGPIRY